MDPIDGPIPKLWLSSAVLLEVPSERRFRESKFEEREREGGLGRTLKRERNRVRKGNDRRDKMMKKNHKREEKMKKMRE